MTIIAGAILMKISFQSRPWTQGEFYTRAKVKMVFIPSILIKHLSFPCLLRPIIRFLSHMFSIKLCGIWDLVILMIKLSTICFLRSILYRIISMILINLVFTACMVKCTMFHFQILSLRLLFPLNLCILTCGVLLLLSLSIALDIIYCLLIIILDSVGFTHWNLNLKPLLNLFILMLWWQINFHWKPRLLDLMEELNLLLMNSNLICQTMVLIINCPALKHLNKMGLLRENIGTSLRLSLLFWLKLPWIIPFGLLQHKQLLL